MRKRDWKRKGKNVLAAILSAAMVVNTALPEALVYAADTEADIQTEAVAQISEPSEEIVKDGEVSNEDVVNEHYEAADSVDDEVIEGDQNSDADIVEDIIDDADILSDDADQAELYTAEDGTGEVVIDSADLVDEDAEGEDKVEEEKTSDMIELQAADSDYVANDYMRYCRYSDTAIDIQGKHNNNNNNNWWSTTYHNGGYTLKTEGLANATVTIEKPEFVYSGRFVEVTYKVTADKGDVSGGKLGVHADVEIGTNDYAKITLIRDSKGKAIGFQMLDDRSSSSDPACFRLYFGGDVLKGSLSANTYWMGYYGSRVGNCFNTVTVDSIINTDSGLALSWQNINLKKGESQTYKMLVGLGTESDLDEALKSAIDCASEAITGIANGTYKITYKDETGEEHEYVFEVTDESGIPLQGTYKDGTSYDFIGKTISIGQVSNGMLGITKDLTIPSRPDPLSTEDIDLSQTILSQEDKTITIAANESQEYILVPSGTKVTPDIWNNAKSGNPITFDKDSCGNILDINNAAGYEIYTRIKATDTTLRSESSEKSKQLIFHSHRWSYTLNDDQSVITASCAEAATYADTCYYCSKSGTIQITIDTPEADSLVYNGLSHEIPVTNGISAITGDPVEIKYVKTNETTETDQAPRNAGTYEIMARIGNNDSLVTAKKDFIIQRRSVKVSGISAEDKIYDGTVDAALKCDAVQFDGILAGDSLNVTATGKFTDTNGHEDKNAGQNKKVMISDLVLGGTDESNYVLAEEGNQTETSASITPKEITAAITPNGGIYGGTITSASAALNGLIGTDKPTVTLIYKGTSNDGRTVNSTNVPEPAGTYTVTAAIEDSNYTLNSESSRAQFIVHRASPELTVSAIPNKDYGDAAFDLNISYEKDNVNSGELSFSSSKTDVATVDNNGKVTITGAGTATLTVAVTQSANYEAASCSVTITVDKADATEKLVVDTVLYEKTYGDSAFQIAASSEGNIAEIHYESGDSTVVEADTKGLVSIKNTGTAVITINMDESRNYLAVSKNITVKVVPKEITVTGINAESKIYDGNTNATLNFNHVLYVGKLTDDVLTLSGTGTFADKNVGQDKTVQIDRRSLGLDGADRGKYVLAEEQQTTTTADITAKEITATITPNGGTYEGTITPADGSLNGLITDDHPTITWTYSGRANDGTEINGSAVPTLAGTYRVTAAISDMNYVLNPENASAEFVINRTSPELSVSAVPDKNYNDAEFNLEITHKGDGQKTYESSDNQKAVVDANGKVTIKGAGDVTLTVRLAASANYTAAIAQVTVKINQVENDKLIVKEVLYTKTYGDPTFHIAASMNGSTTGIHYESNNPAVASVNADGTVTVGNTGTASITVSMDESQNYFAVAKQVTVEVVPKKITISGIAAEGKIYDGTTDAVLKYDGVQYIGKLDKDTLSVTANGAFADKNAGNGKKVNIQNLVLGNNEAGNYVLADSSQQTEAFADITAKEINASITSGGGVYGEIITPARASLNGLIGTDRPQITLTYTGNANDGTAANSTKTPTLAGNYQVTATIEDANYRLSSDGASAPFIIHRASPQLAVSATDMYYGENVTFKLQVDHAEEATGQKVYTTSNASVAIIDTNGTVTLKGGGEVTFKVDLAQSPNYLADSKEVTITVGKIKETLTVDRINYVVTYGDAPFQIEASAKGSSEITYTDNTKPAVASVDSNGIVTPLKEGSTTITLRTVENATYIPVSTNIAVTVLKKKITISGIKAESKVYDGKATVVKWNYEDVVYDGIQPNDVLSITATGTFTDKNAGQNKRVAITDLHLGGSSVGNYELAPAEIQQTEAFADITPKPIAAEITPNGGTFEGTITPAKAVLKDVVDGDHPENGMSYVYTGTSNDGTETVDGTTLPTKAGTYRVTVKITDPNYNLPTEAASADFVIDRAAADLKVDPVPEKKFGDQPFAITASSKENGARTYSSSNENVVKADQAGKVTITGAGTANITVKVAQTANYKEEQKSVAITVKKIPHQLNLEKELYDNIVYGDQSVTVKAAAGDQETGFRYVSSNAKVAAVDASGRITATGVGTAEISITLDESANYLAVTKKATVKVIPKTIGIQWGETSFVYNGKVLAPAATATGLVGTDTCSITVSGGSKSLGKHTATATALSNANYCLPTSGLTCSYQIRVISEQAERELALNKGLKVTQSGSTIRITWGKVKGADGYNVYVQYCGLKFNEQSLYPVKGNKNSITIKKVNGAKLSLTRNYKIYVTAYKNVEGKQVVLGRSITAHIVGRLNKTSTNVKGIKLQKSSFTLKKGKTATIKGSTIKVNKARKQLSNAHAKELRFTTSDPTIATVTSAGKIKAVGKGKCTIYVYARNGYAKKVKVTVK